MDVNDLTRQTHDRLAKIIAEQLSIKVSDITDDATLEQLGADSLDRVEIVMKAEEAFGIELNDDEMEKIFRLSELLAYVVRVRQQQESRPS